MLRGNIAATLLKILWKNLYSVKCYDKSNMNVFTLNLWEKFLLGLIYFDQFTYGFSIMTRQIFAIVHKQSVVFSTGISLC